jgi:hypothetical protein
MICPAVNYAAVTASAHAADLFVELPEFLHFSIVQHFS